MNQSETILYYQHALFESTHHLTIFIMSEHIIYSCCQQAQSTLTWHNKIKVKKIQIISPLGLSSRQQLVSKQVLLSLLDFQEQKVPMVIQFSSSFNEEQSTNRPPLFNRVNYTY